MGRLRDRQKNYWGGWEAPLPHKLGACGCDTNPRTIANQYCATESCNYSHASGGLGPGHCGKLPRNLCLCTKNGNFGGDCRNGPGLGASGLAIAANSSEISVFVTKIEIIGQIAAMGFEWGHPGLGWPRLAALGWLGGAWPGVGSVLHI